METSHAYCTYELKTVQWRDDAMADNQYINIMLQSLQKKLRVLDNDIRLLTEKSMEIQAQEARNKQLMEQKFASVKKQVKEIRSSQKVVNQYYKNMMKKGYTEPHFLDNKK